MIEAAKHYVPIHEFHEKAGARIAEMTGAEAAFISSGAASGMLLAGAACLTGCDQHLIESLPDIGGRPNEFVISQVDEHHYIGQGFRVCGGTLVEVGTRQSVGPEDYAQGISERTAALVFFLGKQPKQQLPAIIEIAHEHTLPVIVDAAAQLPPRSNLTDITAMGADLVVFSGGKGLGGPQSTGLVLGRKHLVRGCTLNSSPNSAIGRGMKVGKEEIAGLVTAVEIFREQDEEAVLREWEKRCHIIADGAKGVDGVTVENLPPYARPEGGAQPPASPMVRLDFGEQSPFNAGDVQQALEKSEPPILVEASDDSLIIAPMTLQDGEAETIAGRLREILTG
jgi:L-seryl-tRNA(Ser) seleniumtransferase